MSAGVWAVWIGLAGGMLLGPVFLGIRRFARRHGLEPGPWTNSFRRERRHLRMLARRGPSAVA